MMGLMPFPPVQRPDKTCPVCGVTFNRARYNGVIEDRKRYEARKTCSQACANSRTEVTKDALHWRARKHRKPACEECGTKTTLHVHHVDRNPANNDPANLRTLCASCHLQLHWREDQDVRMAAAQKAVKTATERGALMRQRSSDGRWSSAG